MTNAELIALLREARYFMRQAAISRGPCPDCTECDHRDAIIAKADAALAESQIEVECPECEKCLDSMEGAVETADLLEVELRDARAEVERLKSALAAHDAVPPSEEKVEWETTALGNDYHRQGNMLLMVVQTLDGNWDWETRVEGYADTEAEAQRAAIAAARGMR